MRDVEPAGPTQKLSHSLYSFSPELLKAERKLSGERAAARFACGDAELLAAAALRFMIVGGAMTVQATHAKFTRPYQRHIASILSRAGHVTFPRVSVMGIIEVRYSWYYYVLLIQDTHTITVLLVLRQQNLLQIMCDSFNMADNL